TTYYNDETNWANGKILYIGNFLIDIKDKSIESLSIKDGTKYIASRALWDCNNIKNISIPASFIGDIDEILRLDTLSEIKIDNKNKVYSKIDDVIFSESGKRLLKYPKSKKATSYSIPKGVTSIADNAFSGCVYLTEIIIPKGVTSIGSEAFMGCDSLAEIIIPEGATNLEYNAFIECKSITRIVIPKSVTDDYISFSGCEKLEEIIIHADMMPSNLEDTAFYKSSSNWHEGKVLYLNNQLIEAKSDMTGHYSIKEGTLSIQEFAFDRDSKLTSITIPKSVKNIEYYSFFCNNLSEISVDEENEFYCDIDGVLFTKDKKTLLTYPKNRAETYTVPSSVTTIAFCAFRECRSLKSLILPNSITEIEESAFSYCKNLKSIVLSESIKEITSGVFSNCESLHSITIPSSVEIISNDAFFECENLKTAIIKSKNIEFTYDYVNYPIFESGDVNDVHFPKTLILNKDCNLTEYSDIFNMIYFEDIESNCKRITDNLENLFQTIKANHKDIFRTVFSVANTFSFFSGILQALVINS
ncbi:MAG: leucine-rich repeat domain-containing protein, partial [Clostridia bacterium]|nr:leucine-rich repeat domain-containing protein [Clostridia bacterium]